jgi:hypothetical protein
MSKMKLKIEDLEERITPDVVIDPGVSTGNTGDGVLFSNDPTMILAGGADQEVPTDGPWNAGNGEEAPGGKAQAATPINHTNDDSA